MLIKTIITFIAFMSIAYSQVMKYGNDVAKPGCFWSGVYIEAIAGDTLAYGQIGHIYQSKVYPVDETVDSTISNITYACLLDSIFPDQRGKWLYQGFMTDTSWSYTAGTDICIDGGQAAETTCDYKIGKAIDTITVAFFPNDLRNTYGLGVEDSMVTVIKNNLAGDYYLETDDLRFPVSAIRLPASNPPTSTLFLGGEVLAFPTNADAVVYFDVQIPHDACDMLVDSLMFSDSVWVHFHAIYSTDGTDPDSVRWVLTYSWANINDEFPAPTIVNTTITVTDRTDSTHYIEGITYIPSSDKKFSSMILMSLMRDVSEDDYAGSVYLMEIDIHYLKRDYYKDIP